MSAAETSVPLPVAPPAEPRPGAAPPRPYHFPRFERRLLSNGLSLVVAPVAKLPLVTTTLVVDAGASSDPEGLEGLASLTAVALAEGTATVSGAALTERFEQLGTSFESDAGWDAAHAGLTVLKAHLADALALMADVLRAPAFPAHEIERLKAERHAEILQQRAEPRGLADEMFSRFVYAPGARFARPAAGSAESVARLGREDVARFYADRYRPGSATLVMAGDVTVEEAEALARAAFGTWGGAAAPPAPRGDEETGTGRRVHVVAKPDAPQSELRIGHRGLPRATPDYLPLVVMNAILGGLFSSRINLNLREAHGYTYGAFSAFEWRRAAGPFEVSTAVRSDVTADAAREALAEIARIREAPVSESELSLATSYLDGVFPIRYESTAAIAGALAALVTYALPDDYFDTYRDRVRAVTGADVQRVAQRHLHPDRLQLVVVGDPSVVREPLERLDVGELRIYDAEGNPR